MVHGGSTMEEKPAEVNTGTHGEQVQVWASSGAGACDWMAGRPWHTKGTGGPAVGPLHCQGPLVAFLHHRDQKLTLLLQTRKCLL